MTDATIQRPAALRRRTRHRILIHHLPVLLTSLIVYVALYYTRPYKDAIARASFATAYIALGFLVASLLIGPWKTLRKKPSPVSTDLRRDVGIWAGTISTLHSVIGQMVHLRGRPWLYYLYTSRGQHHLQLRRDLFGFANDTGLLAALIVVVLLATSNDLALRSFGTPRWKQLQRWNYAAFILVVAHIVGYQLPQRPIVMPFHVIAALCVLVTVGVQTAGFISRRWPIQQLG